MEAQVHVDDQKYRLWTHHLLGNGKRLETSPWQKQMRMLGHTTRSRIKSGGPCRLRLGLARRDLRGRWFRTSAWRSATRTTATWGSGTIKLIHPGPSVYITERKTASYLRQLASCVCTMVLCIRIRAHQSTAAALQLLAAASTSTSPRLHLQVPFQVPFKSPVDPLITPSDLPFERPQGSDRLDAAIR